MADEPPRCYPWEDEESELDHADVILQLGDLVWSGRTSLAGWLSPEGTFIGTGSWHHDKFARRVLGLTPGQLREQGWIRCGVGGQPRVDLDRLTEAQAKFLLERTQS